MEKLGPEDPQRIGAYRLLARLGAGGMGQVFLARSERGRTVAVKLVRRELAEQEEFRSRFRQEVHAARRVGGRWTAPVLDADTEADVPWVATGYVAGPTLQQVVSGSHGPLPERSVVILAAGLARALKDIHAAGLIHRDLKPSNVLVTIDGPRVIDFGIARALETVTESGLTRTGALVGSPGFMAPEQIRGDRVTPACDVFCLGSVLAYAATGKLPFGTSHSGVHAMMYRIAQEPPDLSGVPESLHDLIRDCLQKPPAARPALDDLLSRTGPGQAPGDPWLPASLVAQLGAHAVQLLDLENPTTSLVGPAANSEGPPGTPAGPAANAGSGTPAGHSAAVGSGAPAGPAQSDGSAAPGSAAPGSVGPQAPTGGPGTPQPGTPHRPGGPGGDPAGPGGPGVPGGPGATEGQGSPSTPRRPAGPSNPSSPGGPSNPGGVHSLPTVVVPNRPGAPAGPGGAPGGGGAPEAAGGPGGPPAPGTPRSPGTVPAQPHGHAPGPLPALPPAQPGAYGYPTPPGQYGGYGHPQLPPAGQGHGAPDPYGYPTPPGGYGYPAPLGPGDSGPPPRSNRATAALIAVALVVALGAGGTVYAFMRGDDAADRPSVSPTGNNSPTGQGAAPGTGSTPSNPQSSSDPAGGDTPPPSEATTVPAGFLGTWRGTVGGDAGISTRSLTIRQGKVGDTVMTLTANGPTGSGSYHCRFEAELTSDPGTYGPLRLGPSRVVLGPSSTCSPGRASEVVLLSDGRMRRTTGDGKSVTYTR
ncbi:protein kinase domain-containing protein [Streptomyces sp. CA-294286]|uniref:serine/threonine-protein kinase n=1 Tax=Streptomyces sp. CA-294286 TaxID=3240070 RepID=UPI003D9183FB